MTALITMYDKWVKAASKGQLSGVVLVDLSEDIWIQGGYHQLDN